MFAGAFEFDGCIVQEKAILPKSGNFLFLFVFVFLIAVCVGLGCQEVSSSGQVCKLIHHALGFGSLPTLDLGVRLHSPTFRGKES